MLRAVGWDDGHVAVLFLVVTSSLNDSDALGAIFGYATDFLQIGG